MLPAHEPDAYSTGPCDLSDFHNRYPSEVPMRARRGGDGRNDKLRRARRRLKRRLLMALQEEELTIPEPTRPSANPGPIGLLGFGAATLFLNLANTGFFELTPFVFGVGICTASVAQFVAGLLEFVRGNSFGFALMTMAGAFWASLIGMLYLPDKTRVGGGPPALSPTTPYLTGVFLILWAIQSIVTMCCTFCMNLAIFLTFLTVSLLFMCVGIGNMTDNPLAIKVGGYFGCVCGCVTLYLAVAEIVNEVWDRTILPIVPFQDLYRCLGWSFTCMKARSEIPESAAGGGEGEEDADVVV